MSSLPEPPRVPEPLTPSDGSTGKSTKRRCRTGKGHKKKRQAKAFKVFLSKVRAKRKDQLRKRAAHATGGMVSIGPKISVQKSVMLDGAPTVSQETVDFYDVHPLRNRFLEVSERPNASNIEGVAGGGKGVFATCDIPAGVRVCPYVGVHKNCACAPEVECQYDLKLAAGIFICARDTLEDVGYLQSGNPDKDHSFITCPHANSPNYGRYFNTAMGRGRLDNCTFEIAGDGLDAMFIETSRAIEKGEELLVDYGDYFYIFEEDREIDPEDAADYAFFYNNEHR